MTSVQQQAIPAIMSGRDAMVKSQTGSGKDRHGEDINGKKMPLLQCTLLTSTDGTL